MRVSNGTTVRRWWKRVVGGALALLGLALAGLPESRAQYWAFRKNLPPRESDPGQIVSGMLQAAQQPSSRTTPSVYNTPDNDLFYYSAQSSFLNRSYYPGAEPQRPMPSPASPSPYDISPADLPWNQAGFVDYNEPSAMPQAVSVSEPKKYALEVTALPQGSPAGRSETAVLIAYLPEQATLWVEGTRTRSTGRTRYFQSPPLLPGRKYAYRVRVLWLESGYLVSQTRMIPVQAGLVQALYLRPSPIP